MDARDFQMALRLVRRDPVGAAKVVAGSRALLLAVEASDRMAMSEGLLAAVRQLQQLNAESESAVTEVPMSPSADPLMMPGAADALVAGLRSHRQPTPPSPW